MAPRLPCCEAVAAAALGPTRPPAALACKLGMNELANEPVWAQNSLASCSPPHSDPPQTASSGATETRPQPRLCVHPGPRGGCRNAAAHRQM